MTNTELEIRSMRRKFRQFLHEEMVKKRPEADPTTDIFELSRTGEEVRIKSKAKLKMTAGSYFKAVIKFCERYNVPAVDYLDTYSKMEPEELIDHIFHATL